LEPILPGFEPLAELKRALIQLFGRTEVREVYSLIETDGLRPVIERLSGSERLLLVVDQFEEVFTVCPKEEERRQFIELLAQVADVPASRLAIVTTMRVDFLEPCLSYESLTRLIQNEAVYVPPLVGSELEKAIATPAKLQGYQLETGLLGAVLQDVGQEQGCLPLLQFALTELWEERDRHTHQLTLAKYHQLGGVIGALNRHAEQIYHSFTKQQQVWIKKIFLRLVRTGIEDKDTRQRQPKSKLLAIAGDHIGTQGITPIHQQPINNLLDQMVQKRLLVTGQELEGNVWIDLAHEALMEGWERFAKWRKEDRELRRLINLLEDALQEWQNEPKDKNLMTGKLLERVKEKWQELEPNLDLAGREFYQHSISRNPAGTLKTLVGRLYREQHKIQDFLSSLGFALRSFNNLSQFVELIPLMTTRIADADGGVLILFQPNGQIRLEQIYCHESQICNNIRKAIETATRQVKVTIGEAGTEPIAPVPLELLHASIDEQVSQYLGADVQLFGIPILIKNIERGRLYVFSHEPEYNWTPTRQKLVRLIADQTAVAIETFELRNKESLEQ
jgi:DNA-binding PadR family transcriptional regulator